VLPPPQVTEQEPVQVTWQVEPSLHETLPLGPTVTVQVDPPAQSMLHDSSQVPLQTLSEVQASEQLPAPQLDSLKSQASPAGQVQLAPVQSGGMPPSLPQPASSTNGRPRTRAMVRMASL